MKLTVADRTYRMHIRHDPGYTTTVAVGEYEATRTHPPLFSGVAFCHPKDRGRWSRQVGRKLAFAHAIAGANRGARSLWWAAYYAALPQDITVPIQHDPTEWQGKSHASV